MDRHNISIYDSEKCRNILSQLPGIFAIRLHFGNGDNGAKDQLTEIHVLASTDRNPKQIARDIQSTLFAVYGVEIDHRIISIAQLPQNPFAAPQPVEAPVKPQSEPEAKAEASAEAEETVEPKETEETEETAETEAETEPEIESEIESEIEPLPEIKPEPQPVPETPAKNEPDVNNAMYLINQLQNLAGNAAAEQNKDCSKETRLLFTGIDSSHNNGGFDVNVHLSCDGHDYSGTGHCRDTVSQCNRIVAQATAEAVNSFLGKEYFNPLEVKMVNIWDVTVAVTLIEFQEKARTEPIMLVGAAVVKDNSFSGIVRSTLDGLNRCLCKVLPAHTAV